MSNSDSELPISQTFIELVEAAKAKELEDIEAQVKRDREHRQALFRANNSKLLTAGQMFAANDEEEEDRKRKAQVLADMAAINKDVLDTVKRKKQEVQSVDEEDGFPEPPIK